jgi:hypothetical protein
MLFTAGYFGFGTAAALLLTAGFLFILFRPAVKIRNEQLEMKKGRRASLTQTIL